MRLQSLLSILPFYLAFVGFASAAPTNSTNATSPVVLDAQTDAFINKVLSDWKSPGGVAVAFVRRNAQGQWVNIETKGYGRATYAGAPVTKDTTFNIGSNSKVCMRSYLIVTSFDIFVSCSSCSMRSRLVFWSTTSPSHHVSPGILKSGILFPGSMSQMPWSIKRRISSISCLIGLATLVMSSATDTRTLFPMS